VPVGSLRYRNVHLLQTYLDLSGLQQLALELPTGVLTIDGESIHVGEGAGFFGLDQLPSNNDYSNLPGYLFESSNRAVTSALPQEPLVDFNLPYYRDIYDAIRDWIGLRKFHYFSDARIGHVWLFLPECRARFGEVKISASRLRIEVTRGARHTRHPLLIAGSWNTPTGAQPISLPVSNTNLETKVAGGATGIDLFLVDPAGTIFDYHQETAFLSTGQSRVIPSPQDQNDKEHEPREAEIALEPREIGDEVTVKTPSKPEPREIAREVTMKAPTKRVFIVHGHDDLNLLRLEKLLRGFGLEPVVLTDRPGKGRPLIVKFEEEARTCAFAFVLMTPDDLVRVRQRGKTKYAQARPNALFEMGWLYRHLDRERVCILCKRGTKIQTELEGIDRIIFTKNVEEVVLKIEIELTAAKLLPPH
jgi:predicted nucleotide-binding protein